MLEELGQRTPELEQRIAALETMGKTVVMLVSAKGVHALFAVADTIKESSRSAIAELHALGINTMMLTGDNPHTAQAIAAQAGIDRAQGNLLPDDKLREVELLAIKGKVGMVGDGINDAPALARADIGFAMGAAGTDTAIETADVALMDDNLGKIPTFVRLSRATAQVLMQNIVLALGIKAVLQMSWKFFLYDWGGLNIALFQAINMSTPAALEPLASFFNLVIGNYWTAPLMLLAMWGWSKSAPDPTRADAIRYRLRVFSVAFALAFLVATILKLWIDFPRPPAVFGDMVRVIGGIERHYSLPSGHATYAALVVGALWPLIGRRGRIGLVLYAALVGWSRIAAGMHFPADVLAGWVLGLSCTALAGWLMPLAAPVWQSARRTSTWVWFAVAASAVMTDQLAKFAITRTFAYGEQVEVTPFFNFVHVLNPGAAFSFLANAGGWQRYFFITLGKRWDTA